MKPYRVLTVLLIAAALSGAAAAQGFPPITDRERSLTSFPGEPNAPAVVLSKKSEFLMMGYGKGGEVSSSLLVKTRIKILTEKGKSQGEVSIPHSSFVRLQGFQGRTVLPDGRVLPVPADARFERKVSRRQRRSVTSVAFPGVEVGAILDYQYELRFDTFYFLEPWYFSDELPVLRSEVTFKVPRELQVRAWSGDPFKVGIQNESKQTPLGTEVRVWAENLPSVPDEPYGLPFSDLATQIMLLPVVYSDEYERTPLLESWVSACKIIDESQYDKARRRDGGVEKKAREIAGTAGGNRQKAEALYRFVRDEIATEDLEGVLLDEGSSVERTLSSRTGDYVEKAMLLQALLKAVKMEARLVWAAHRWRGRIDAEVANPGWFDRALVLVEIDGQRVFLDPSDRALGFGQIQAGYEGTPALVYDKKKPEPVVLPESTFDQNGRRAVVDLKLDEAGQLTGTGELVLTGHPAWEKIDWQEDDAKAVEAWKEWLTERYKDFQIADVRAEELPDERKARLTWSMKQREEEVLGDESSLAPSLPLGPAAQPFVQAADQRRSPVLFPYADFEEVELRLSWPAGWTVEATPSLAKQENAVGGLTVGLESNGAERSLVYRRRLELRQKQFATKQHYEAVRALYAAAEKSDAQAISLVRR